MKCDGVTVYCMAYNHEKYIEKTLNGFVSQIVSFPYKVIVHDDASTDKTKSIIQKYATQYPDIIIPVYQKENQYSKGIDIYKTIIEPMIDTELVAICEGDDYWTDSHKIQMQYDYMTTHSDCSLCVHNTMYIKENGEETGQKANESMIDRDYSASDVIAVGGGGLFHTSSFCYRLNIRKNIPEYMRLERIGDYPLAMYCAMCGNVHFIGRTMSAYRMLSDGSWSKRTKKNQTSIDENIINMLTTTNKETDYKYADAIEKAITRYQFKICVQNKDLRKILSNKNIRRYFNTLSLRMRLWVIKQCIIC